MALVHPETERAWLTAPERASVGRAARKRVPRQAIGEWGPSSDRPDPVGLLEAQAATRVPELRPIRYGRMGDSPFAFYRGAAAVMASDLSSLPVSGFEVQACGDAHCANFGVFASPERDLLFDVNDFDETSRGPWEWDVARLVTSLVVAGRQNGYSATDAQSVALATAASYRSAMRGFADLGNLQVWYAKLDASVIERWRSELSPVQIRNTKRVVAKARGKDSSRALSRLTERDGDQVRFLSDPPLLVPLSQLLAEDTGDTLRVDLESLIDEYRQSLRPELQGLLRTYRVVDMARKVVGVGSVGTRCWVVLLSGRSVDDPLVLQAKEAQASVLEPHIGASPFANHGERVVVGQRSMQTASDIFLGWLRHDGLDGISRDFYLRQMWDSKGSADPAAMVPSGMRVYGAMCGWTLARAHARTGDRVAMASYLGSSNSFDRAITRFAERYADQNEKDHQALLAAADDGRVEALAGL